MAYWEFLLQKEGDRSWLPLESPDVEILEGRYRVVARSNRVNTSVEVRILHQADLDSGSQPQLRSQKRAAKTNQDGLIVVLPFTWLQPGSWELRCTSDVMADMLGQAWTYTVQLLVQPQESALDDGWVHELEQELNAQSEAGTPTSESSLPVAPSPAQAEMVPASAALASDAIDVSPDVTDTADAEPDAIPAEVAVSVHMDQDSYTARSSHPLVLTGKLLPERSIAVPDADGADSTDGDAAEPVSVPSDYIQALQIRLLNPQTGEACLEQSVAVEVAALPFEFACHLESPKVADTHLLVGRLTVLGRDEQSLTQQSFTVATDLEDLLQAIADESILEGLGGLDDLNSPFALAEPPDLSLLNLVSTEQESQESSEPAQTSFQVTNTEPIPPQLYQPDPVDDEVSRKPLDLPSFSQDPHEPQALEESDADAERALEAYPDLELEASTASDASSNAESDESVAASALPTFETEALLLQDGDAQSLWTEPVISVPGTSEPIRSAEMTSDWMSSSRMQPKMPQTVPLSSADQAFQALNLQTRFLQRLSALASDAELHTWLRSQDSSTTSAPVAHSHNGRHSSANSVSLDVTGDRSSAQEFVIDDDDTPSPQSQPSASNLAKTVPEALKMPEDQSIPSPQLVLSNRDLIAGQTLQVVVTLPNVRSRLSVKLWLQDPQTRELLDGPYWLTTFSPNGHDQLESGLQIMVPFGCLEVQFEAIAVEVATQRESHKATVHRSVNPPDSPTLSNDEIGL